MEVSELRHLLNRQFEAMKYNLLLCFIIVLLVGCKRKDEPISLLSPRYTVEIAHVEAGKTDAVFSIERFIKLQTTDRGLINQIAKVISYQDRIYILTAVPQNSVLIFASDGTFLTKISKGRANNELFYPTDVTVDEYNDRLMILDYYRNVKTFTRDGKYVSSYTLSDPQFYLESIGNDKTCLYYSLNMSSKNRHSGYYGIEGKKLQGRYKCSYIGQGYINSGSLSKFNQDSTLLCPMFSDTVYLFNMRTKVFDPYFIYDFSGKSANSRDKLEKHKDIDDYNEAIRTKSLFSGPQCVHFVNNKLYFYFHAQNSCFYVYDTCKQELTSYPKMFDELPNYYGKIGQTRNNAIFAYDIPWLKKHFQKYPPESERGKEIAAMCNNEEDNPILVFAKIK